LTCEDSRRRVHPPFTLVQRGRSLARTEQFQAVVPRDLEHLADAGVIELLDEVRRLQALCTKELDG
jgi:hypothetical protein